MFKRLPVLVPNLNDWPSPTCGVKLPSMGQFISIDKNKETCCVWKDNKYYLEYDTLFCVIQQNFEKLSHRYLFTQKYFIQPCNWPNHSTRVLSIATVQQW